MRKVLLGSVAGLVIAAGVCGAAWQPADEPPGRQGRGPDIAGMLVEGLENSPGCLGVDAGRFQSGKMAIIGWFENKAAVLAWYNSPVHQRIMSRISGGDDQQEALAYVTDENTPIMVIASITPTKQGGAPGSGMPFSQIAIELYAPLPGGAYINSRLAPEAFEVPHMRKLTVPQEADAPKPEGTTDNP